MEALFYIILVGQVFLLSYHYPMAFVKRVEYILDNYPAKTYPKLYPSDVYVHPEDITRKRINGFKYINFVIGLIGIAIIIAAIINDFKLNEKGSAAIFVTMYLLLQFIPHFMLEIYQFKHYKHMRELFATGKRSAELVPRNLSNFIPPFWVTFAVLLFIFNIILFLYYEGFGKPWTEEIYTTVIVSSLLNVMYFVIGYKVINGKKTNPFEAHIDQMTTIKSTVSAMVFASIMMSLFFIALNSVREFGLDKWEPLLMSVYFQLIIVFGLGHQLRSSKVEDLDFEVYKDSAKAKPA